ncbi:sortase [Streptococcus dysgalactiae subsp. equisimilis]|uniref:class B sortase n=1 Tax=Streptococcus dysgalactiae TaxID=1334 RepID=UPI0010E53763|nr:class B sortase [Streptococcus dysgalactiae]VTT18431.1 sortase [Streptococcus dysgalactiae subsp. equisimilis]
MSKLIDILNKIVDGVVLLFLLSILLVAGLGLWDSLATYQTADNGHFRQYKNSNQRPNFDELLALNSDVVAWLDVNGTNIDYPVVQGKTNLEYINKSVEGEYSLSGSVFLDYRNSGTFEDFYSLIYAHHMAGDVMFGELPKFREKSFFKKHKKIILETKAKKKLNIDIVACLETDAFDELLFNPSGVMTVQRKQEIVSRIKQKALQYREIVLTDKTQLIALSTCEDTSTDGRIIVIGKVRSE